LHPNANIVRALGSLGEVDFFAFEHKLRDSYDIPPGEPPVRAEVVLRPKARAGRRFDLSWLAGSNLPRELAARDYTEARRVMSSFARLPYDLTWIHVATGWSAFGDLIGGPMIVDLDDLQDYKLAAELRSGARRLPPRSTAALARFKADMRHRSWQLLMRTNIRRWHAVQRRIVEGVDAVAVCSQLDYKRLAAPTAEVIPNCYTRPAEPAGRLEVGEPPTIVFPGTMVYEPNADAAEFFVNHVLPRLRRLVPAVRVRLVGSVGKRVKRLGSADGVTATGVVPDITSELRRADILIAPIRYGGGTRLKILEGFAHQIPVVSTTLGHEGLEVVPEEPSWWRTTPTSSPEPAGDFSPTCRYAAGSGRAPSSCLRTIIRGTGYVRR
jgi:glycosyltransferase involved in cell wall biosynthesis